MLALRAGLAIILAGSAVVLPRAFADAPTAPPQRLIVALSLIGRSSDGFIGVPRVLFAEAVGVSPVTALQLWVDGKLVEESPLGGSRPRGSALWRWTPTAAGNHLLIARASDADGRAAYSNAIWLRTTAAPELARVRSVRASGNETLAGIAVRSRSAVGELRRWNPDVTRGILPRGMEVIVPQRLDVRSDARQGSGAVSRAFAASSAAARVAGIALPEISATTAEGCTTAISIDHEAPNSAGLVIYQLTPGASAMSELATIPSSGDKVSFEAAIDAGTNAFAVGAFDDDIVAVSDIVTVEGPAGCDPNWTGDAKLIDGLLVTKKPADEAYFYLRVGDEAWRRVPRTGFLAPKDGGFDASGFLPALDGKPLAVEAWGRLGGALVSLGAGRFNPPPAKRLNIQGLAAAATSLRVMHPQAVALGAALPEGAELLPGYNEFGLALFPQTDEVITVDEQNPSHYPIERQFRWTSLSSVTKVMWHVTRYPLSSVNLDPPGIIDWGVETGPAGKFSLDLTPYFFDVPQKSLGALTEPLASSSFVDNVVGPVSQDPFAVPTTAKESLPASQKPTAVYVRVIPFVGNQPLTHASNAVQVRLQDHSEVEEVKFIDPDEPEKPYLAAMTFRPPRLPNGFYVRCVLVVGTTGSKTAYTPPLGYDDPVVTPDKAGVAVPPDSTYTHWTSVFTDGDIDVGDTICRPPSDDDDDGFDIGDAFEAFVEAVADAVDAISSAAAWLKDQIVTGLVKITACEQLASEDTCKTLATIAVDVALISAGIPPNIPNFSQLVDLGKGELAELAVDLANDTPLGVACQTVPEKCKEVARAAIDKLIEQYDEMRSGSASSATGIPIPPGFKVIRDPRGLLRPPHFTITLMGAPSGPAPHCAAASGFANMTSHRDNADYAFYEKQYLEGDSGVYEAVAQTKTGPVTGSPFHAQGFTLAQIGQSVDVWLTRDQPFWPGGHPTDIGLSDPGGVGLQSMLLAAGSELSADLGGCISAPEWSGVMSPKVPR